MKLLFVGDFHYSLPQFDWLVETAPKYNAVIIAGDLLDIGSIVDPGTQIVVVLQYLKKLRAMTRLVVCSGNHDIDLPGPDGEKHASWMSVVRRLSIPGDGDSFFLGDLLITACPWWDGLSHSQKSG